MRVPISWVREFVDLPEISGRAVAEAVINTGLEVETVDVIGGEVTGPVVVGHVISIEELTEFKKPIRFCRVKVGAGNGETIDGQVTDERGVICGARNFAEGDLVVVALPGAVLPGGFAIGTRQTYGRTSDGMICSERELGLGDDHNGIIVLEPGSATPGDSGYDVLGLGEEVLDIAVTPDRGYALSIRGVAREIAQALGLPFHDPALIDPEELLPEISEGTVQPARIGDPESVSRFVMRTVEGFDPSAASPGWMRRRLIQSGMRPVSLAVDVTNYLMLELGQPLHAFDRDRLQGTVVARRAEAGETLETLDHINRTLTPEDLVIADDRGPIGLAGVMGGLNTEIEDSSSVLAIEAAHFDAVVIAKVARRHKLSSEASRRFERGVDPQLPAIASARAVALLVELGGGRYVGTDEHGAAPAASAIAIPASQPGAVVGLDIPAATVTERLEAVGCTVQTAGQTQGKAGGDQLRVTPPSWRPDLRDPADLVEEVIRLGGYNSIPSTLPQANPGQGLSREQRLGRRASRALASAGLTEVLCYPFVGQADFDTLGLDPQDPRRRAILLANPLSDEQPGMRTTLLPGLIAAARRNLGRGFRDLSLYETGSVFLLREGQDPRGTTTPPHPGVTGRPSAQEMAELQNLLPDQPTHAAGILAGDIAPDGWWGAGRQASWADAISAVRSLADELGVELSVTSTAHMPWHPGRCAQLAVAGEVVGHAGELHPRVVEAAGLPPRTAAFEVNLSALMDAARDVVPAPVIGTFPLAKEDVALVVDDAVNAQSVQDALRAGAGDLLESIRLFDVYTGSQVGEGRKSLAFALRFRAEGRTLSADEVAAARDAAIRKAADDLGALHRA